MLFKKCFSLSFLLIIALTVKADVAPTPPPFGGFNPNMTEEEILNQFMQEINAALPEAEREKFWKDVAEETERLEKATEHMNPEEKEKYLLNIINTELGTETPVEPEPVTTPQEIPAKPALKPEKPIVQKTFMETDDIIKIISDIVKSIESFIAKAIAFPDFDGKVHNLIKKGRITDWEADCWAAFRHELDKFVALLQRFKDKDPKIGFKHLDELGKKEAMLQSLKQLRRKLNDYETIIKVTPFEIASMSEQTKNAAINVINALTDALYRNKIMDDLVKIIELFDPIAKQLREEEEKAAKTALSSKKSEYACPVRISSTPQKQKDSFTLPSFDDLGFAKKTPEPLKGTSKDDASSEADKEKGGKGKTGGSAKGGQPTGKDDKSKDTKGKKPGEDKKDEKKEAPAPQIKHTEIQKNVNDLFRKDIEDARSTILETPEFQSNESLKQYLLPTVAPAA